MRKLIAILTLCAIIGACDKNQQSDDTIRRTCGGFDVEMTFDATGDIMHAVISGDAVDLTHTVTASGTKYIGNLNDTDVALWGKGNDWILILDDENLIECRAE